MYRKVVTIIFLLLFLQQIVIIFLNYSKETFEHVTHGWCAGIFFCALMDNILFLLNERKKH